MNSIERITPVNFNPNGCMGDTVWKKPVKRIRFNRSFWGKRLKIPGGLAKPKESFYS
ncbi:MAG: hypothetical protein LBU34_17075 [Planctomycetaceae bacterium]|nr:hypothetical protein [Planctomycetaceae bacterium]